MFLRPFLLYLSFQLFYVASKPAENFGELVFTTILYRHGDRTPINPYPNDPYKNNSLWPAPWGELTDVGKRGHYEVGKWLRKRYGNLLPKKYVRTDIHIRSTDVDRTLMSAYSNLAGLYEPDKTTNWSPDILWNPIPVHTIPEKLDEVLYGGVPCPKYQTELANLYQTPVFRELNEKNKELYEYLSEKTGSNVTSIREVASIYDNLLIEEIYKFELPEWTKAVYPEPLRTLSGLSFQVPCYTRAMARLRIGSLFKEIIENMEKKIAGSLTQKAWMYSAHDTTVANVLQGLGVFEPHCPPYLSLILFELIRKNEQDYYVTMHYRNSSLVSPYLLRIPGCGEYCSFEQFKSLLSDLIPDDWDEECEETSLIDSVLLKMNSIGFLVVLTVAAIFFLSLIALLKYYKNRRWNQSDFAYTILKMDVAS